MADDVRHGDISPSLMTGLYGIPSAEAQALNRIADCLDTGMAGFAAMGPLIDKIEALSRENRSQSLEITALRAENTRLRFLVDAARNDRYSG